MAYLRYINGRTNRHRPGNPAPWKKSIVTFTGTVKWFNTEKGYGFIIPDDGSPDVFVHISAVLRSGLHSLQEGQSFEFELVTRPDGRPVAERLKPL